MTIVRNFALHRSTMGRIFGGNPILVVSSGFLINNVVFDIFPIRIKLATIRTNISIAEGKILIRSANFSSIGTVQHFFEKFDNEIETIGIDFFPRLNRSDEDILEELIYGIPEIIIDDITDSENIFEVTDRLVQARSVQIRNQRDFPKQPSVIIFNWINGLQDSRYRARFIIDTTNGRRLEEVAYLDIKSRS